MLRHVATRQHEAALVAGHRVRQPVAVGRRADEEEEAAALAPLLGAVGGVAHRDPAEPAVLAGAALDDLGAAPGP